jgi:hypothetical protein
MCSTERRGRHYSDRPASQHTARLKGNIGEQMTVDFLYLAWEREAFTQECLRELYSNTDWSNVSKVYIYTDAGRVLDHASVARFPNVEIVTAKFGSPVAIMNDFLDRSDADIFVKLDNDVVCPPGWLGEGLRLLEENPFVDLLGIEPHLRPPAEAPHGIQITGYIGGVGFMRRKIFSNSRPSIIGARFGFTEWQLEHVEFVKAWIDPPLKVFLLDHLPFEPWHSLSAEYRKEGWQRNPAEWGEYGPEWSSLWEWWRKP